MATNMTENQPILKNKQLVTQTIVVYHVFKHEKYDGAASSL